ACSWTAAQTKVRTPHPIQVIFDRMTIRSPLSENYGATHEYDAASAGGPALYRGYAGYEQSGRLPVLPVRVADFGGAAPFSTQSSSMEIRSKRLGICVAGIAPPSPFVV